MALHRYPDGVHHFHLISRYPPVNSRLRISNRPVALHFGLAKHKTRELLILSAKVSSSSRRIARIRRLTYPLTPFSGFADCAPMDQMVADGASARPSLNKTATASSSLSQNAMSTSTPASLKQDGSVLKRRQRACDVCRKKKRGRFSAQHPN
jgi:hypothetical protein